MSCERITLGDAEVDIGMIRRRIQTGEVCRIIESSRDFVIAMLDTNREKTLEVACLSPQPNELQVLVERLNLIRTTDGWTSDIGSIIMHGC